MLVLALAGLSEFYALPAAAKAKPDAAAASAADGEKSDLCLQDGLCRAHYTRARGLSKESDYEGALTAYEAAYHRRPVPWLLLNIGRTLHKLGKPAEALGYYRRYQQEDQAPAPERQKLLKEYTEQAEADVALQKSPASELKTAEKPPGPAAAAAGAPGEPPPGPAAAPDQPASDGTSEGSGPEGKLPARAVAKRLPLAGLMPPPEDDAVAVGALPSGKATMSRTGLWAGLGVTGGFLLVGASLAITAQVSSAQLHNTTYVGSTPTPDVMALQERTRGTAISADVFFGITAVSLGVTLLATLLPKHPRARPSERAHPAFAVGTAAAVRPAVPGGSLGGTAAAKRAEEAAPAAASLTTAGGASSAGTSSAGASSAGTSSAGASSAGASSTGASSAGASSAGAAAAPAPPVGSQQTASHPAAAAGSP